MYTRRHISSRYGDHQNSEKGKLFHLVISHNNNPQSDLFERTSPSSCLDDTSLPDEYIDKRLHLSLTRCSSISPFSILLDFLDDVYRARNAPSGFCGISTCLVPCVPGILKYRSRQNPKRLQRLCLGSLSILGHVISDHHTTTYLTPNLIYSLDT
jgi:hypothetical protein